MKVYGNAGAAVTAREGLDLPTQPFRRPASWPDQLRNHREWTSPIPRPADDEGAAAATRAAEQAAAAADAREARQKAERERKAAHAKADRKVAPKRTTPVPKPAARPVPKPPPRPRPTSPVVQAGQLTPSEVERLVAEGLARMTPAAPAAPAEAPSKPVKNRAARPTRIQKVDPAEAVRLYTVEGLSTLQIAERFGAAAQTVYHHLRAAGVQMRHPAPPAAQSRIDVDEAIRLYAAGWTLQQIGDRYGVSHSAVSQRLRARNVPTRGEGGGGVASARAAAERRERLGPRLRVLYSQQPPLTLSQIAVDLDISEALVKRMAKELDLPPRRQRLDGAEIVRLYVEERLSIDVIAARLGTAGNAIRYRLHCAGINARPRSETYRRAPREIREQALTRLRAGDPVMVVAKALGLGATTVSRWRDAAGIPARPTGSRLHT